MTYRKPEITILGKAFRVLQGNKSLPGTEFGPPLDTQPAYELDE